MISSIGKEEKREIQLILAMVASAVVLLYFVAKLHFLTVTELSNNLLAITCIVDSPSSEGFTSVRVSVLGREAVAQPSLLSCIKPC